MTDQPETARVASGQKPATNPTSDRVLFGVAAAIVVLDQLTKWWATRALADGPIDLVWTLRFNLIGNTGAAFSRGEGLGPVLGLLILAVVIAMVAFRRRIKPGAQTAVYGLILGGAVGNLLDRLFRGEGWLRGAVVDFIDFQWYPVFNVADMGVVIGGLALVALSYRDGGMR